MEPDLSNISDQNDPEEAQTLVNEETDSGKAVWKRKLQIQGKWKGVGPVLLFKDQAVINSIKMFYGIDDSFPFDGHLISRNSDKKHVKRIFHVSNSVKDVLELNFRVGQQLQIASIGLKMFVSISSCYFGSIVFFTLFFLSKVAASALAFPPFPLFLWPVSAVSC